jgi:hypothetical protein
VVLVGGREFCLPPVPVLLTERAREVVDQGVARGDVGQFVGRFRRLDVSELERQVRADLAEERLAPLEGGLLLVATQAAVDERSRPAGRSARGSRQTAATSATLKAAPA